MKTGQEAEVISRVCGLPYLTDARITELGRKDDGQLDYIEFQASWLVREYPDDFNAERDRPSKKTLASQHLIRFERELGRTRAEYYQIGPTSVQEEALKYRKFSPTFKWSVGAIMKTMEGKPKPFLQVWRGDEYVREVDLSLHHGEFGSDEFFGWVGWDEAEDWFIYQAEGPEPKLKTHTLTPSYGETLPSKRDPHVFVFDLRKAEVKYSLDHTALDNVPTQILYVPEEHSVYYVGYEKLPKHYGMAYCLNRPCLLHKWKVNKDQAKPVMTNKHVSSIHYPVHDLKGKRILFFGTQVGGSHYHAFDLYAYGLASEHVTHLIKDEALSGIVNGLFPINNPQQTIGHGFLIFSSFLKTQKVLLSVSQDNNVIICSPPCEEGEEEQSWRLHQVHDSVILASCSSRTSLPRLMVGFLHDKGQVDWYPATKAISSEDLSTLGQSVVHVDESVNAIVLKPKGKEPKDLPLIVFPHGGPNFAYVTDYSFFAAIAAALGYAVAASTSHDYDIDTHTLIVNYTGSAGYGYKSIKALEGQIGTRDVNDCLQTIGHLTETLGYSKNNMFLYGGSHGGFLVAHLSCRPEFDFKACAAVNAVIDLPSMCMTSDIPDFAWGQLGLQYDLRAPVPPGRGELEVMRLCSPSSRVHQAKVPTIVLLGEGDLRVPPSQGIAWHTWLKAKGIPTECYQYPGTGHAIDSPEGEYQELFQTFRFFAKYK